MEDGSSSRCGVKMEEIDEVVVGPVEMYGDAAMEWCFSDGMEMQ